MILSEMLHPRCYEQIEQVKINKSYQSLIKILLEFPYFSYIEYQTRPVKTKAIPCCMYPQPVFVNIPYNDVTFFGHKVNILLEFTDNELTGIGEFKKQNQKNNFQVL